MADECVMNACSGALSGFLGPVERGLEAIVAPEELAVTDERRGAEDAACLCVRRLLLEAGLDVGLHDSGKKLLGIKVSAVVDRPQHAAVGGVGGGGVLGEIDRPRAGADPRLPA